MNKYIFPIIFFLIGCQTTPSQHSSQASSGNDVPPKIVYGELLKSSDFKMRGYKEKTLSNGLKLLIFSDDSLPTINLMLSLRTGSANDQIPGVANFVTEMLDKGTVIRNATEIANTLDLMGADFNASADEDQVLIRASSILDESKNLIQILSEIILQPAFNEAEIARLKKQVSSSILRRIDQPGAFASEAFQHFLYANHPYSHSIDGNLKSIKSIQKKHLVQFYLKHFRPNNAHLAIVGKIDDSVIELISDKFSKWQSRPLQEQTKAEVIPLQGIKIKLFTKPEMVQAQIRIGHFGIQRNNPDLFPLKVTNTILGGHFTSKLVTRIRKELGLTYSIQSSFEPKRLQGPFVISTFTKNESVATVIKEILGVIEKYKVNGASEDELMMSKNYLSGTFPFLIETAEKYAQNILFLKLHGLSDQYLSQYLDSIAKVTQNDVKKMAEKYFDEKNLKIVVFGSPSLAPMLKSLGNLEVSQAQSDL